MIRHADMSGTSWLPHPKAALRVPAALRLSALMAVGCLAACAVPAGSTAASTDIAPAGPVPAASAAPGAGAQPSDTFRTLPPGTRLPGDQECARRVPQAAETEPVNAPYNATAGSRRLPADFFDPVSNDRRAITDIAPRVSGAFTGTTPEILRWVACKWGIDERYVRAQAMVESSLHQPVTGDWTTNADFCAPGHGLDVDGRPGQCPESWGILQVRYRFFRGAFPDAIASTAFNVDTAYAVWRACFDGYETWLGDFAAPGNGYRPGDAWGCIGRWFSGRWYDLAARQYIGCVRQLVEGREPCL
jgi:autotransporter family porin